MQEFNGFDQFGGIADPKEILKQQRENEAAWNKLEYLIHATFEQNPSGKELLQKWKEALIMTPVVTPSSTPFQAGIEEGKKEFIRNILLTIKKVEADK